MWLPTLSGFSRYVFGWAPESDVSSRETAWLDGVRGIAAFLVMINHYNRDWLSQFVEAPFGATVLETQNPDGINFHQQGDRLWAPWRLPLLKLIATSGGPQVAIFFVLSGMVLSWSPLGKIRAERYDDLYHALGSSVVRRWFRLFLPCALVGCLYMCLDIYQNYHGILSALQRILDYLQETERWANPFETVHFSIVDSFHSFSIVMWTIPIEFAGSIFVYVSLLSFGRIQHFPRRAAAILVVTWYAFAKDQWGLWLFGHGTVIADYVRHHGGFREISKRSTIFSNISWTLVLLVGFLLMGYVAVDPWYDTPGYRWFDSFPLPAGFRKRAGAERAFWGVGGISVVLASCHLGFVRRLLETALAQHLGKISFMLYLVHFFVNSIVGQPLKELLYSSFCAKELDAAYGSEVYRYTFAFNTAVYLTLLFVVCGSTCIASHVLEMLVDRPCTAFGKWIDNKIVHGIQRREKSILSDEETELLHTSDSPVGETLEMREV